MINISDIKIPYEELLSRLGFLKAKTEINQTTETLIKENLDFAKKLISPKAVLSFERISINQDKVLFENGYKIESSDIAELLKGCFMAYGAAITIGTALENKRNEFIAQKETLRALVLDAAGSVAAEECIKSVNNSIKQEEEKKGNKTTKRFSCGYGDWLLDSQKDFLFWLGADKIGIKTNDSFMMIPEKSISAIIGIKK